MAEFARVVGRLRADRDCRGVGVGRLLAVPERAEHLPEIDQEVDGGLASDGLVFAAGHVSEAVDLLSASERNQTDDHHPTRPFVVVRSCGQVSRSGDRQ